MIFTKKKFMYHITEKKYVDSILKEGLKPMIGENSKLVNEDTPRIYITKKKDIPFWSLIFNEPVILKINTKGLSELEEYKYKTATEYMTENDISKDYIQVVNNISIKLSNKEKKKIAINCILTIFKNLLANKEDIDKEDIEDNISECKGCLKILNKVDFNKNVTYDDLYKAFQKEYNAEEFKIFITNYKYLKSIIK